MFAGPRHTASHEARERTVVTMTHFNWPEEDAMIGTLRLLGAHAARPAKTARNPSNAFTGAIGCERSFMRESVMRLNK